MLRTSYELQRAQCVHRACNIRIHTNQPATAWADPPKINLVHNTTVLQVEKEAFLGS